MKIELHWALIIKEAGLKYVIKKYSESCFNGVKKQGSNFILKSDTEKEKYRIFSDREHLTLPVDHR